MLCTLKSVIVTFLIVFVVGCSSYRDVPMPPVMVEHQQPYPLSSTSQAKALNNTQVVIEHQSDVVTIKNELEYVFWTDDSVSIFEQPKEIEVVDTPDEVDVVVQEVITPLPVAETQSRTCKKIYCDVDKNEECGSISWCEDGFCDKDLSKYYDCEGESCVAKYAKLGFIDQGDCDSEEFWIHPQCMGKGSPICAGHNELYMCNNLAKQCQE